MHDKPDTQPEEQQLALGNLTTPQGQVSKMMEQLVLGDLGTRAPSLAPSLRSTVLLCTAATTCRPYAPGLPPLQHTLCWSLKYNVIHYLRQSASTKLTS
jgi:hypothetical protein